MTRTCLVVPCFDEESRLDLAAFERKLAEDGTVDFILVNDGSRDRTLAVLQKLSNRFQARVRVIDQQPNQGKAEAVRRGMLLAFSSGQYDFAGYWDADLATPLEATRAFVDVLQRLPNVEIVFGARVQLLGRKIARRAVRHYSGRVFATAVSEVLSLPIYDTQCGAKLFRVNAANQKLFEAPFLSRWIFDVEIAARHLRGAGEARIYELPLEVWTDVGESKVRPLDFLRAMGELAAIHRTYRRAPKPLLTVLSWPGLLLHYLLPET
jgi:dolichyl-phosphate beta-glucosyltransferase